MTNLYIPDRSLPRAFICDVDGTLSDHEGIRGHFEYSKVSQDRPIFHIIHIVQALECSGDWVTVFVTGREDSSREDTQEWLLDYTGISAYPEGEAELYMRKTGDYRKDSIIKKEIFERDIAPKYWVEFALDDRNQVVDMWRGMGLPCLQVAQGDF